MYLRVRNFGWTYKHNRKCESWDKRGVEVGDISEPEGVDSAVVEVQGKITAQENGIVVYQKNTDTLYNN